MSVLSDWTSLRNAPPPAVAVEITAQRVSAASLEMRAGRPVVTAHGVEPLPAGALVPSLTAANTHDRTAVLTALGRVLERVGRPRRIGLIVPDPIAKVSLVRFEKVPARAQDLDQLIRWQVRKAAPFAIEEGQVSYVRGILAPDGQEFVVTLARRDVVQEYEDLCASVGAHAGLVDISTFNVINAVLAGKAPEPLGGLAPGQCRVRLHLDCHSARPRSDFLSQPQRRQRGDARRSGASDGDVLRGSASGRGVQPRHAVRSVDRQR